MTDDARLAGIRRDLGAHRGPREYGFDYAVVDEDCALDALYEDAEYLLDRLDDAVSATRLLHRLVAGQDATIARVRAVAEWLAVEERAVRDRDPDMYSEGMRDAFDIAEGKVLAALDGETAKEAGE